MVVTKAKGKFQAEVRFGGLPAVSVAVFSTLASTSTATVLSGSASFRVVEVTKWLFNFFRLNANRITPLTVASRAINCGELRH